MKEVRLYFEGDSALRSGFREFFSGRTPIRLVATNGTPIQDYEDGIRSHPDAVNLLLLDSDDLPERRLRLSAWPADRVFWRIRLMESWFLADKESLKRFYQRDFNEAALPPARNVETIPKRDVEYGLKEFSRRTQKGPYHKTKHAPAILALIDSSLVRSAAADCDRLFQVLESLAEG